MLAAVVKRKLKASSIIETIVAVLILLLSFTAGMVMYNKVVQSTYSGLRLRAQLQQGFVADSLAHSGGLEDGLVEREDIRFEVNYKAHDIYPSLLVMRLQGYDLSGNKLSEVVRVVRRRDETQN
jgi:hypothetical protein